MCIRDSPNSAYTSYILKVVGNTTAKTKLDVPELVKKVQENSKKDIEDMSYGIIKHCAAYWHIATL